MVVKKKNRLMSIDPSINNVGMAIWDMDSKTLLMHKLVHPKIGYRGNEYEKSWSILEQAKEWIQTYTVNHMILEVPEHWAVGGFEARETGSIAKLSFVCGLLFSLKGQLEEMQLVVPRGWKGQLPKKVVAARLKDEYIKYDIDMTELNENVMDAIGIGHFRLWGSV